MKIKIELTDEAQAVIRDVQRLPDAMLAGIAKAMGKENDLTVGHIQRAYLAFAGDGPTVPIGCRHITGRLKGSLRASKPVISGQEVSSAIGSNVEYAAAQEFGATIPAHTVTAKNGKALRFQIGQRVIFAKSAKIPEVNLPAREFIQRGIGDRWEAYSNSISDAIVKAWKP